MANYEATKYDFSGANLTGIEGIPTATIVPWSSASVPTGFLECNGQAVSRSTYAALFAIVGTTYGAGDGSSTFLVPDLQDNVAVGKSNNKALASTGGANTVAVAASGNVGGSTANASLSTAQLASHNHNAPTAAQFSNPSTGAFEKRNDSRSVTLQQFGLGNTGSGQGHSHNMSATFSGDTANPSVLQPYLTVIYIIKT
jgi:microcystin-dependent protein